MALFPTLLLVDIVLDVGKQVLVSVMTKNQRPFLLLSVMLFKLLLLFPLVLLVACASSPRFKTEGVETDMTPKQAVVENQALQGKSVLWGGVIITATNLKESTQLEILAYPLGDYQQPVTNGQALGRFLAVQKGYLETADYAQGRQVTVKGSLGETRSGRIGETEYVYPVVNIHRVHLWPKEGESSESRVRFGIGVMFSN